MIPLIIEQLLAVLVGMVDVIMVASVGEAAVSGVSLVDSISILIISLMAALATGGAVVCAQYIGKKEPKMATQAAGQLLLVATTVAVAVTIIALIGNRHFLSAIFGKLDQQVLDDAVTYFFLVALSYPCLAVYNSCAALYRSMGNSKISMQVSMLMNGINVVGNAICIYGLHMGVEGVAIPTLISRGVAAVVMMKLIQNPDNIIRITSFSDLIPNRMLIGKILQIGVPNGVENSMFQIGKIGLQSLTASLGTAAIAGNAVGYNLATIMYLPGTALGLGLITIVGQCVGAGRHGEAKKYTKQIIVVNYGILLVLCTLLIVFRHQLVGIYNLSQEASNLAVALMTSHALCMVIWPLGFTLPYTLRASGDVKFTLVTSVGCMWFCRIGLAYVFVKVLGHGVLSIWVAMYIDWVVRVVLYLWRFRGFENRRIGLV